MMELTSPAFVRTLRDAETTAARLSRIDIGRINSRIPAQIFFDVMFDVTVGSRVASAVD